MADKEFDYTKTPAYRRKVKRDRAKAEKKAGMLVNQGPITILIVAIIDFVIDLITRLGYFIWEFSTFGFKFVYDIVYGSYDGLIPNSEKFGMIVSMAPLRYFVTLLVPPVGIFLSKGLNGWFNIIICFILLFIHFVFGVIYAFVITYRNRYADRFEKAEYQRLMIIRQYVKSCTGDANKIVDIGDDNSPRTLIFTIVFFVCFIALLVAAFKYL
jgi:uncharacterized membrane protein YqaE (UPF0057 family)